MSKILLLAPVFSVGVLLASAVDSAEEPVTIVSWLVPLIIIAILILLNGLYVASEFAIIGSRPSQLEAMANEGNATAANILKTVEDPAAQDRYIATAQLGITIASLALGMYAEPALEHLIEPYLAGFGLSETALSNLSIILVLGFTTYLHVVVGEMVPKSLALSNPATVALRISRPMGVSQLVLTPLVRTLNAIGNGLLKLLQLPPAQTRVHSPEEIELIVTESTVGGLLNEEEEEIIRNIFDFSERTVGQVMTPRRKVQLIPIDMPLEDIKRFVASSNHSRFPIYEDNRDHILGILHLQDLIKKSITSGEFDLRLLLNIAPAVPEDTKVEDLLRTFKERHIHMAIVLDEFGGMAGVVTLEDLVEEVVGEVRDEYDVENEPLVVLKPGMLEMDGNVLVDDLLDHQVPLPEKILLPDVDTVGGLVVTWLGRPPKQGDQYTTEDGKVHFTVLDIDGLAVARLQVAFLPPDQDPQAESDHEQ